VLVVARGARMSAALLAVALAGLLVAPATWAVETLGHPTSGTFPAGGPLGADAIGGHVARAGTTLPPLHRHRHRRIKRKVRLLLDAREIDAALRYAHRHGGGTLGVRSQEQASGAIIASGANVAGLGGFSGAEAEMSVPWFAQAVHSGRIRWVLFNGAARVMRGHRVGATKLLKAVAATCPRVPRRAFARGAPMAHGRLYDCRGHALALELYAQRVKPRAIPQAILTKLSHRRARLRRR
jgi:hypothetical protein